MHYVPGAFALLLVLGWVGWTFWQTFRAPPRDHRRHVWAKRRSRWGWITAGLDHRPSSPKLNDDDGAN